MGEILVLARRHLRSALRTRAARVLVLVYLAAVLAAIWIPSGEVAAGSTLVLFALIALALLVYGVASGAGNGLPADRRTGRVEWLRTTAPPAWKHRTALVVAGWTLAVLAGALGGLAAAVAATVGAPGFELRPSTRLEIPAGVNMKMREPDADADAGPPVVLNLPVAARAGSTVELDIRPQPTVPVLFDYADITWRTDGGRTGDVHVSVWTPLRIDVPEGTRALSLRNRTHDLYVRVLDARLLGSPDAPSFVVIFLAGLLMGFMAGAATPVGVVISRFTSGATASAAAFCLLVYGTLEAPLLGLVSGVKTEGAGQFARIVLTVSGWAAPDLQIVELIGEISSGRAVGQSLWSWLPALLIYAAVGTFLAAVPLPGRWTERKPWS